MQLPDVKQLEALLTMCRKKGVASISIGEMKIELREEEPQSEYKRKQKSSSDESPDQTDKYKNFPDGVLTPEQLIFYSAGGLPEDWDKEAKA